MSTQNIGLIKYLPKASSLASAECHLPFHPEFLASLDLNAEKPKTQYVGADVSIDQYG